MKLSLSTNWIARKYERGEEIVDKALFLGFQELELGFHTSQTQVEGFKKRLSEMPVGSVHAFCPVPNSAPCGYPELYSLASFSKEMRALALVHVKKNIQFAAEMGAKTLVLHAGRVNISGLFEILDSGFLREILENAKGDITDKRYMKYLASAAKVRTIKGRKLLGLFKRSLEELIPELEKAGVVLALENMPYYEGFPSFDEMAELYETYKGSPIRAWFDTGHHLVQLNHGWTRYSAFELTRDAEMYRGMHLNDIKDFKDDHFAPGFGTVDFAALKPFAEKMEHVVVEPSYKVTGEELKAGIEHLRKVWGL